MQRHRLAGAGKNLSNLEKIGNGHDFFVRILNSDIVIFTSLLFEPDFDSNLISSELSDLKKIEYRLSISYPKFNIIRFVQPEFEFLLAL